MFKNQLQELAQRSCFNLPSYACIRQGPDHAPRFKASVNFNGEIFESPTYSTTTRQAEHAAAEVALNSLAARGPSRSLTTRVLDETGVYKNLLQETAHRAGLKLPVYTTIRSGPGHVPVFTSTVELAGMNFTGESAKTKKQAEKNAAIAAWSALKRTPNLGFISQTSKGPDNKLIGKRYQNQPRRRMLRPPPQQQKRLPEILPPNPPKAILGQSIGNPSQVKVQEIGTQLDEHDDKWIGKKTEAIKKVGDPINSSSLFCAVYKPSSMPREDTEENARTQKRICCQSQIPLAPLIKGSSSSTCSSQMGKSMYHSQRIAPAVQIRSVIPVCAAPPVRLMPLSSNPEPASSLEVASTLSKLKL